ncbi:MAG TPA: carboxypeptidase regulatory-like domain-containing protein [Candidatus Cloacimonadota bacterium]|nr:carboxypeptidase regulatory-like domain-containing protein [Candidatus Cloacimonadota bacterium]
MKTKLVILAILLSVCALSAEQMIVGTVSGNDQGHPLSSYRGYVRSAAIYNPSELGAINLQIDELAWYCGVTTTAAVPVRIYLKATTATQLQACTWSSITFGATQVYSGTMNGTTANSWQVFSLDSVFRIDAGLSLLVLVETIYRVSGSGTAGGGYFGPKVSYTWYGAGPVYYHQVWSQNHTPLIGDGTLERGRPVIRINYTPFTTSGLPCPPMLSYPLDGELRVHPTSILSWSSGGGWPTGYKLYFGQDPVPSAHQDIGTAQLFDPDSLAFSHTYYWQVIPYNALGDALDCPVWSFTVRPDSVISSFPHLETFDDPWVGYIAAPFDWKMVNNDSDDNTWKKGNTNLSPTPSPPYAAVAQSARNDWLITPPINLSGVNAKIEWWERCSSSSANSYRVMLSTTDNSIGAFTVELGSFTCSLNSWARREISLFPYNGETIYLAFHSNQASNIASNYGIDNFKIIQIYDCDLSAVSLATDPQPFMGSPSLGRVRVQNPGLETQADYLVQIVSSTNQILASQPGTEVLPGEYLDLNINFVAPSAGVDSVFARVVLVGDSYQPNDQSPWSVYQARLPEPYQQVIGSGNVDSTIPLGFSYRASLFQTIYSHQAIGNWGSIPEITLYTSSSVALYDKQIKIWMQSTDLGNLSEGWVPVRDQILVFNGLIDIQTGISTVTIPLDTPFNYCRGSLLLTLERCYDSGALQTGVSIMSQSDLANRSRYARYISTWDPNNPQYQNLSPIYPKLGLQINPFSQGPEPHVYESAHDFGVLAPGSNNSQTFRIYNIGASDLTITGASFNQGTDLSIDELPVPINLIFGQSFDLTVRYRPTEPTTLAATLSIQTSPGNQEVSVQLQALVEDKLNLGVPTLTQNLPFSLNYGNAVYETIYQAQSLLHFDGVIHGIRLYHSPAVVDINVPVTIWLGPTDLNDLSTGWINAGQLNLVYDGPLLITQDASYFDILFSHPYQHNMQNLALLVHTGLHPSISNPPGFMAMNGNSHQTRHNSSNTTVFDPHSLSAGSLSNVWPQTSFLVSSTLGEPLLRISPANPTFTTVAGGWIQENLALSNYGGRGLRVTAVDLSGNPDLSIDPTLTLPIDLQAGESAELLFTFAPADTLDLPGQITLSYIKDPLTQPVDAILQADMTCNTLTDIVIGSGTTQARRPIDFSQASSLYQAIYYPSELEHFQGFVNGLSFYNNFASAFMDQPTQIWMGITSRVDMTEGPIPSSQMTLVFDGMVDYPAGQNTVTIEFDQPYIYLQDQNLVISVFRPMSAEFNNNACNFLCQNGVGARAWIIDSSDEFPLPESPQGGDPIAAFPKTRLSVLPLQGPAQFHINSTDAAFGELALGLSKVKDYLIQNTGTMPFTLNSISLAGSPVFNLSHQQDLPLLLEPGDGFSFSLGFSAIQPGSHEALLTINDDLSRNPGARNRTQRTIPVSGTALSAIQVGFNSEVSRMPVAMNYRNSIYETIFQQTELTGLTGYITGLRWSYRFMDNLADKPIRIWLGNTPTANLAAGWIPATQLTLVYDGSQSYQSGIHDLDIGFDTPFLYQGGNLAMMVQRPMDTQYFSAFDQFFCSTVGNNRSRKIQHDSTIYDPNSPPTTGSLLSGQFPNTIFFFDSALSVSVSGRILAQHSLNPIAGASIELSGVDTYVAVSATDGVFQFPQIPVNSAYQYTVSAPGYQSISGNVSIAFSDNQMGDLLLLETAYPPANVSAELDVFSRHATITWQATDEGQAVRVMPSRSLAVDSRSRVRSEHRILTGFHLYRLAAGQETVPDTWIHISELDVNTLGFVDSLWIEEPLGEYRWAVQAIYTGANLSPVVFSNILSNHVQMGQVAGMVQDDESQPLIGAQVSAGDYAAATDGDGNYLLELPAGVYTITATAAGYASASHSDVMVLPDQPLTLDFTLDAVSNPGDEVPALVTALQSNWPNPFKHQTNIRFSLQIGSPVSIRIYDIRGRLLRSVINETRQAGIHNVVLDASDDQGRRLPAGVYLCRFQARGYEHTIKLLLLH